MASNQRTQNLYSDTGKKQALLLAAAAVATVLLIGAVIFLLAGKRYTPPAFDSHALSGVPNPDEGFLYDTVSSNFGYEFSMAANLYQQEDATVKAFFTNPKDSQVNLMCEIRNEENGKLLYKSGVIRPGEYVESIAPSGKFPNVAMQITVTVYAFEPESWLSAGTTVFSTILQAW